ncbi:MAG: transcriptional regulator, partial [Actinomycetota bacterium]
PTSGVALRVEVVAKGETDAAFTSAFREFSSATPPAERVTFEVPPGADFRFDSVLDIADAANQYAPVIPPDTVAGLAKSPSADRAVGIYGSGVTSLLTIPMRDREAGPLRDQLKITPGAQVLDQGTSAVVGPLAVLLTGGDGDGGWLIAGTVTRETLVRAAHDLASGAIFVGDR